MNAGQPVIGVHHRLWHNGDAKRLTGVGVERLPQASRDERRASMKSNAVRATGLGAMFAAALAIGQVTAPSEASAQVIERGVQGGIAGAIIGGIIGGGKGAGRGAAIGAGVGVVTGAIERDNLQRAYAYGGGPYGGPNLVYDTQVTLRSEERRVGKEC